MYYVLHIAFGDSFHGYYREGDVVYVADDWCEEPVREFLLRNGSLESRVISDYSISEYQWSFIASGIILKEGTASPKEKSSYAEEAIAAINRFAPVQSFAVCDIDPDLQDSDHDLAIVQRTGQTWFLSHFLGGYDKPKPIYTKHPVTFVQAADEETTIFTGPISWLFSLHQKFPQSIRKLFRMVLLAFRRLEANLVLFLRVAEMI